MSLSPWHGLVMTCASSLEPVAGGIPHSRISERTASFLDGWDPVENETHSKKFLREHMSYEVHVDTKWIITATGFCELGYHIPVSAMSAKSHWVRYKSGLNFDSSVHVDEIILRPPLETVKVFEGPTKRPR